MSYCAIFCTMVRQVQDCSAKQNFYRQHRAMCGHIVERKINGMVVIRPFSVEINNTIALCANGTTE